MILDVLWPQVSFDGSFGFLFLYWSFLFSEKMKKFEFFVYLCSGFKCLLHKSETKLVTPNFCLHLWHKVALYYYSQ